ncbi:MAG: T9SS type A sorting domain-containing protein [Calditrichaeota bacterium]|nr:T9SS type A sorting domain-containing protein [Calditrichota bacterium]
MKRSIFRRGAGFLLASFLILQPFLTASVPDTIRVLAIRVEFQEDTDETTTGNGKFDLSQSDDPFQIDPPPHNRLYFEDHLLFLKNYYWKVSRGRLLVLGEVFPREIDAAYQLPQKMAAYNPNTTPDEINRGLANLFRDALLAAAEDPEIDFRRYQSVIVFHAGVGKDVDLGFDATPQDIPSLFITRQFLQQYLEADGVPVKDGVVIYDGIILPETESQDGYQLALNGILVANFASQLGWLDLFNPKTHRSGIGRFGLMDAGLFNGDGLLPALPSAWTRIQAGWETAYTVYHAQDEELQLHWVLSNREPRVYRFPINEREYFLVENRYAGEMNLDSLQYVMAQSRESLPNMKEVLLTYFPDAVTFSVRGVLIDVDNPDRGLPGSGILIWHIDENVIAAKRAENRINDDDRHRGVDLEEADGSQDIGQVFDFFSAGAGSEIGTVLDLWYEGNPAPVFKNEFSPNTFPNSRSYYNRANSHIKLSHFSRPDSVMTFRARLDIYQSRFPLQLDGQLLGRPLSIKMADITDAPGEEILILTDRNRLVLLENPEDATHPLQPIVYESSGEVISPPAVMTAPDGQRIVVLALREGRILLLRVVNGLLQLQTGVSIGDSVWTFPVVDDRFDRNGDARVDRIFVGTASGRIWKIQADGQTQAIFDIGEPVVHLLISDENRLWAVGRTGRVYLNGEEAFSLPANAHLPAGNVPLAATADGQFILLEQPDEKAAIETVYPVFSPPSQFYDENYQLHFALGSDNRLLAVSGNLAMKTNFPVTLYRPYKPAPLRFQPLIGVLSAEDGPGIVVVDEAGVLDAFDFQGERLAAFPLSVGDSIATTPALGDFDGDGDVELVAITRNARVYAWDLTGAVDPESRGTYWMQEYANPYNQNRLEPVTVNQVAVVRDVELLPAERAYCWPNPNQEDFTIIRYWLAEPATVSIRVYDLAGELVDAFTGPGNGGVDNEVRWDLADIQSGVYFARIQAKSARREAVQIIKIAVVK